MKRTLFLIAFSASFLSLKAQDILVRKNGEIESVKVLEVSPTEVKFKKSNNPEGPVFIEKRSNLASINYQNGEVQTFKASYYEGHLEGKKFTHEADLYLGAGWGVGYQLRREFNQYVGWNIIGISYMNDFSSLSEVALINLKLAGVRGYTPSYKWFRGYADLCLGYSFLYDYGDRYHYLGMDLNLGVQVHRNFAFGIDLIYCTPDPLGYVGARASYIF
ncbi:MAG: hypothetical protein J6W03_00895 [Bacteroidaceae bacterium]|nr:hypothetical protein [Bacteroidaceae bacterium]